MRNTILLLTLLHFTLFSFSQEIGYGVTPYPQSIKKSKTSEAKVISDINPRFPTTWIKEYISVELSVTCNGETLTAEGVDATLNKRQQDILKMGETGTDIVVSIKYYPNNNLPKEIKEMSFTFNIAPDHDAQFIGGEMILQQYFKENVINQLSEISNKELHQAKVRFNINQNGKVYNAKILEKSHSRKIDQLLLTTIDNMPIWTPAKNNDGTIVGQAFEFIVTKDQCIYKELFVDNK